MDIRFSLAYSKRVQLSDIHGPTRGTDTLHRLIPASKTVFVPSLLDKIMTDPSRVRRNTPEMTSDWFISSLKLE